MTRRLCSIEEVNTITKSALIIIKSSESKSKETFEGLRIAMSMIGMDMMPKLLFCDEAVSFLWKDNKHRNDEKYAHYLETLAEMAGIKVLSTSLEDRHLLLCDLIESLNPQVISPSQASKLVSESDLILAV